MEEIKLRGFIDPELQNTEAAAIDLAANRTDTVLDAYTSRPDTHEGRYVCADSFKELMPRFGESPLARSRFNGAVHNAAAVLASEQFRRLIEKGPQNGRDKVVFITGIPGAGKSSTVQNHSLRNDMALVFEGQLSRPEPTMEKIERALNAGFEVAVVAVHVPPEVALERTNQRFNDPNNGRGASLAVMADIQGGLPHGLQQVEAKFGDSVSLSVLDNTPGQVTLHRGWSARTVLEKEGNREHINNRLLAALESGHAEGRFSDDFYRQAAGHPRSERGVGERVAGRSGDSAQADEHGRSFPQGSSEEEPLTSPTGQGDAQPAPPKATWTSISEEQADGAIHAFFSEYRGVSGLKVVHRPTQEDFYGPKASVEALGFRVKGAYLPRQGHIHLALANFRDEGDLRRSLQHEALGHYATLTFSSTEKHQLLEVIIEGRQSLSMQGDWKWVDKVYADRDDLMRAEEVYCLAAEQINGLPTRTSAAAVGTWSDVVVNKTRPLEREDLQTIVEFVAEGIRRGTRVQQIFPEDDRSQFRKTPSHDAEGRAPNEIPQSEPAAQAGAQAAYTPRNLREAIDQLPGNLARITNDERYGHHTREELGTVSFYKGLAQSMAIDAGKAFDADRFDSTMADRSAAARLAIPPSVRQEVDLALANDEVLSANDRSSDFDRSL